MLKHPLVFALLLAAAPYNQLTDAERRAGFQLLFDGQSLSGWELAKPQSAGKWIVEDGSLVPQGRPRELMTVAEYGDFEFLFDWKIAEGGNSGVMYRVEKQYHPPTSGPEYQLIDDRKHSDAGTADRRTASAYAIYAAPKAAPNPPGEWNSAKILAKGAHVEHWLNGAKVLEYEIGTPDWRARVAKSKFAKAPQYAQAARGRIVIQDHGSAVWFRNLKLRVLD